MNEEKIIEFLNKNYVVGVDYGYINSDVTVVIIFDKVSGFYKTKTELEKDLVDIFDNIDNLREIINTWLYKNINERYRIYNAVFGGQFLFSC